MADQNQDRYNEEVSDSTGAFSDLSASDVGDEVTWIEWFCRLKGNEFFVEIDEDYVQDDFNLTYLNKEVMDFFDCDIYREALNVILDYDEQNDDKSESQSPLVEQAAQYLYGLIHARFILTSRGMAAMFEKYSNYEYGSCPLLDCHAQNQAVLPMGLSDVLGQGGAKVFCPRCIELYEPKSTKLESIDGAFFGTSFSHLFFLTYPHLKPATEPRSYVPRIFGFKVSSQMRQTLKAEAQRKIEETARSPNAQSQAAIQDSNTNIISTNKEKQNEDGNQEESKNKDQAAINPS